MSTTVYGGLSAWTCPEDVISTTTRGSHRWPGTTTPLHSVLVAISLGFGLLSTLATSFAFYWFVRMKRSFRHDLIMLLIVSDFIKSAWFVIFPIVVYTLGPIASESAFCQISGFSLAVGFESSDVAVLLIALHSALYIIRPDLDFTLTDGLRLPFISCSPCYQHHLHLSTAMARAMRTSAITATSATTGAGLGYH